MPKRFQLNHKLQKKSGDASERDQEAEKQEDWFCAIGCYNFYDLNGSFYVVDKANSSQVII